MTIQFPTCPPEAWCRIFADHEQSHNGQKYNKLSAAAMRERKELKIYYFFHLAINRLNPQPTLYPALGVYSTADTLLRITG